MEMMSEVFGITDENRAIYELVNRVKYAISGLRQDHREALPKILAEQFSRKLSKEEWSRLHLGIAKTDVAALAQWTPDEVRRVLSSKKALDREAGKIEERIRGLDQFYAKDVMKKAEELAEFMVTGKVARNLLRNATEVAHQFGERGAGYIKASEGMIQAVDELTTLYALRKIDDETRATVAQLAKDEAEGMDFLNAYLVDLKGYEAEKTAATDAVKLNGWKGYVPSEARDGSRLIVASDKESKKLMSMGYTRIGDYRGAGVEDGGRRGYYFSAVAGSNTYHQGVMQTVQTSVLASIPGTVTRSLASPRDWFRDGTCRSSSSA